MAYLDEAGLAALVGKVKGQMVELTAEEYAQIDPAKKNYDNKLYFVKDEAYAYPIDNEPTANSDFLVKSGGVYNWTSKIGSGSLTTTAKTIIPAVNELNVKISGLNNSLTNLNTLERLTINRTISTTYISDTSLNRLRAYKRNGMLTLILNLHFDGTAMETSDFTEICSISGWTAAFDSYITIPMQNNFTTGTTVQITSGGKVRVFSKTPISGFHRGCVTAPCA